MAVKCKNGHWYDPKMFKSCPHCKRKSEQLSLTIDRLEEDDKTVSIAEADISLGEQLGQMIVGGGTAKGQGQGGEAESDKTVSFGFFGMARLSPVTGWLVCMNGTEKGKDYRLHAGKNFLGRSTSMDVILTDDKTISRDRHASVTYDPKGNEFYVIAENANTVYHNQKLVESAQKLCAGDEIQIGETILLFIPFCQEGRVWEQ